MIFQGTTVHSWKQGLGLPCGKQAKYKKLGKQTLQHMQNQFLELCVLFVDEFSMLRQCELHYIDQRLCEIMADDSLFSSVTVVLSGDPAQLPAVGGKCVWDKESLILEDLTGFGL